MTIQALDGQFTVTWPWPQVRVTSHYVIVAALADFGLAQGLAAVGATTLVLFELYNDGTNWIAEAKCDLGVASEVESFKVMDFGLFYAVSTYGHAVDGSLVVKNWVRNPRVTVGTHSALPSAASPNFITGCNFNGQAVIAGIVNSNPSWQYRGTESILWSAVGRFDFTLQAQGAGGVDAQWGDQGNAFVFHVAKLGKGVLAIGDGGRLALAPFSEPVSTFAPTDLVGTGVASPNHCAGDHTIQGFITHDAEWITYDGQFKETNHDYKEFLKLLNLSQTIVSYDSVIQTFFICDGVKCFVFKNGGLYETHQMVTSVGTYRGKFQVGFFNDTADYEVRLTTDTYDFKQRGLKTVEGLEPQVSSSDTVMMGIQFKTNYQQAAFTQGPMVRLNPLAISSLRVTANDFRFQLQLADYRNATFNLAGLKMRVKLTDYRNVRGLLNVD